MVIVMKFSGMSVTQFLRTHASGYLGVIGGFCFLLSAAAWGMQMRFGGLAVGCALVGLACLLAYLLLDFETVQAQLAKRSVKYGANVTVMIVIVFCIIVLIEAISSRHSFTLDLTRNQRFTLSDKTNAILKTLAQDVTVVAFFGPEQGGRQMLEDLLPRYAQVSPRLKYEFVDPDKEPGRAKRYAIKNYGTIVLETAQKQEKTLEPTEAALTNALVKVTRAGQKAVYFLTGHGEHDAKDADKQGYSLAKKALENENYAVKDLLLMQQAAVPADAAVVVLAGPQKDLVPAEVDALQAYLRQGGKVLGLFDPDQAPNMKGFLQNYGVLLGDDLVLDPVSRVFGAGYDMPVATTYQAHPITDKFTLATFFPVARSVRLTDPLPKGITGQTLASSSPQSWAETNKAELQSGKVEFQQGQDLPGPVPLAAVVTIAPAAAPDAAQSANSPAAAPNARQAKLVIFGDSDFASNAYLGLSGNTDLLLNTISWLAEEEGLIAIRAKNPELSPLMLSAVEARFVSAVALMLLPFVVVVTGVTVYLNRRKATR